MSRGCTGRSPNSTGRTNASVAQQVIDLGCDRRGTGFEVAVNDQTEGTTAAGIVRRRFDGKPVVRPILETHRAGRVRHRSHRKDR